MRSLAIVRDSPLGMSSDTAVCAATSAINNDTHSLVSADTGEVLEPILELGGSAFGLLE